MPSFKKPRPAFNYQPTAETGAVDEWVMQQVTFFNKYARLHLSDHRPLWMQLDIV